jgi:hypothetical protein
VYCLFQFQSRLDTGIAVAGIGAVRTGVVGTWVVGTGVVGIAVDIEAVGIEVVESDTHWDLHRAPCSHTRLGPSGNE